MLCFNLRSKHLLINAFCSFSTLDIHDLLTIMLLFLFTKLLMKIWFICVVTTLHRDASIRFFGLLWCDEQAKLLIVTSYSCEWRGRRRVSSQSCGRLELTLEAPLAHYKKPRNIINWLFNPLRPAGQTSAHRSGFRKSRILLGSRG